MLRYGIPQYRLPKVEVLEAEYESVTRLGGKIVCNQGLGRDFTLDDLQYQGFDAIVIAIGCYDTNKLGIPGEDAPEVLDGLEYLRTATLGLPYPNHEGKRVVVIGGGFTSMDCSRTSIRQGAKEVTLVYRRDMKDMPASNEVHEAIEEGVTAIFQAGPVRVVTDKANNVTGVEFIRMKLGEPDASGRRRPEPAPGTEFTIPCDRVLLAIGQGPELDWIGPGSTGPNGHEEQAPPGRRGHVRDRPRRACSAPATSGSAPRPSSRRSPRAAARPTRSTRSCAATTSRPSGPARPSPSREPIFLSIVPFTSEVKEPRYRLKALEAEERKHNYVEYEFPYSREEIVSRVDALPPVHLRGDRLLRPAPPRDRVRDDAHDARAEPPPGRRPPVGQREPVHRASTTTTSATTRTPSSFASRRAASTAAAAPRSAPRSSARRATTSCGSASTRSSRRRST